MTVKHLFDLHTDKKTKKKSKRRLNTMTFTISLNRQGYIYINLFVMNNITLKEKSF
jgi:hypothetical protein